MSIFSMFGGPIATLADDILKMFPNAEQRMEAQTKLQDLISQMAKEQTDIDAEEARSGSWFLAGWRPFVAWVSAIGLTYSVVQPILHLPAIDVSTTNTLLYSLLGLGTLRSADKIAGVATTAIKGLIKPR